LSENPRPVEDLILQREREYLLGKSRVTMRSSLENIEAGEFKIVSVKEGESVELPRWAAEELVDMKLAEMVEEPFETEIFKSLSREKMLGPFQLSPLAQDFYMRMKRRLHYLTRAAAEGRVRKEEVDRLRVSCYDLIGIRLGKLLSLSSSSTSISTISDKLTPEERVFFTIAQGFSKEWKGSLLGEKV